MNRAEAGPLLPARLRLPARLQSDRRIVGLALLIALLHGLVFVFLMPPWQHYDEPNHFEVARLLADQGAFPTQEDRDPKLARQVIRSMTAHDFFDGMAAPDLTAPGSKLKIPGHPQFEEPELYYRMLALPLRLLPLGSVTAQLYAGRLVSLGLLLVSVLAAWGLAGELTPPGHPLRLMLPVSLALLPGFVDVMTAVNNDALAVAVVSLLLWGGVRLIQRGPTVWNILWVLAAGGLCLFAKSTAMIAAPLAVLALALGLLRPRRRPILWAGLAVAVAAAGLAAVTWGDAAGWYLGRFQENPNRATVSQAPVGGRAFRVDVTSDQQRLRSAALVQLLDVATARSLSGRTLTLGAWVWADRPVEIRSPGLQVVLNGRKIYDQPIRVDQTPRFYAFTFTPEGDTSRLRLLLSPVLEPPAEGFTVFYDGVVLAEGRFPGDPPPEFDSAQGEIGRWGGRAFTNLLRNPSAESAWPRLRGWVERLGERLSPDMWNDRPSLAFYTLLDIPGAGWYYRGVANNLFETFWARFGWGHVYLTGTRAYLPFVLFSAVGLAGAVFLAVRRRRTLPWSALAFLGLGFVLSLGLTMIRGSNYIVNPYRAYYPVARYLYPFVLPALLALNAGWLALGSLVARRLRLPVWLAWAVPIVLFFVAAAFSWFSIYRYYYFG